MRSAMSFVDSSGQRAVEQAIEQAERRTCAEIVCAVATESGRYDRAEAFGGLVGALAALSVAHGLHSLLVDGTGRWDTTAGPALAWQSLAVVVGFVVGNMLLSFVHPLRRLVTSEREMGDEVARAASHVFALRGLRRTRDRGGMLIYVSLFERRVVVLAGDRIMRALGQPFVDSVRDCAASALRSGERSATFVRAVEESIARLEPVLPAQTDNTDELFNELLRFHPRP